MGLRTSERYQAERTIVYAGVIAAMYYVLTLVIAPISFGPLQLRLASMIVPVVLLNRRYAIGVAIGVALANIMSPFGWYDWLIMPFVSYLSYLIAYGMREKPWFALTVSACITSVGVAVFPLHMGASIPVWPTALFIFVPQITLHLVGWYIIWNKLAGE